MKSNQGHWVGLKADTKNNFGFIYVIRDLTTGYAYVGKKQFWTKRPRACRCKTAIADKGSPKWQTRCWQESNWRAYTGSSVHLNKHIKENPSNTYEFEIIKLCRSRGILTYSEVQEQWGRDVLGAKLEGGEYRYFNRAIGAIKFRPPAVCSTSTRLKMSENTKGPSNPNANNMEELFIFRPTGEKFRGTRLEFMKHSGMPHQSVLSLVNGGNIELHGWRLWLNRELDLELEIRREREVGGSLKSRHTGEKVYGYSSELCESTGLSKSVVNNLLSGRTKVSKDGWVIN